MKGEKDIAQMDFAEYLRKSSVLENRKVYRNERYCFRLVKVDEMYKISKSLLATSYWPRHEGGTG